MSCGVKSSLQPHKIPKVLKPLKREENLADVQITPYSWISDGKILPIEQGLPIHTSNLPNFDPNRPSPMDDLVTLIVDKPYLEEFYKDYGSLMAAHPHIDPRDPDNMSHYEKQFIAQYSSEASEALLRKQTVRVKVLGADGKPTGKVTTKIPIDAHLYTWGGAIPDYNSCIFDDLDVNVPEPKIEKKKVHTGIYGEHGKGNDESSLIREIHFQSLGDDEPPADLSQDSATTALKFEKSMRSKIPPLTTAPPDTTVKQCIKRFFDPNVGIPFVPSDVDSYFPLDLLNPELMTQNITAANSSESIMSFTINPYDECDPKSTLLDTKDQDILFTKEKAPFTRNDIATIRQFNNHWDQAKIQQRKQNEINLKKRQALVRQAFNSRETFETYLKLVEEDCKRCRAGLIGKTPTKYKKKSMWEIAVENTPDDPSTLKRRREFWWRFCKFVRISGGVKEQYDEILVNQLRNNLKKQHPVNTQLFFDVIKVMPSSALQSVNTLRLVDFLRILTKVEQDDFLKYLKKNKIPTLIYTQTMLNSLSRDQQGLLDSIINGPMEIPPCE